MSKWNVCQSFVHVESEKISWDITHQSFWTIQWTSTKYARCNRWKMMSLQNQLENYSINQNFEEVVSFWHPFRGECKADIHAAWRWITCGNFCAHRSHVEARKCGLLREKAVRKCCLLIWKWIFSDLETKASQDLQKSIDKLKVPELINQYPAWRINQSFYHQSINLSSINPKKSIKS